MGQCCFFFSTAFIQAETQNTCSGGKEKLLNASYWDPKICVAEFDEDTACKKYKIYNKCGLLVTDSGDGRLSQIILFHQEPTLLSSLLSSISCRLEISHRV